MIMTYPYKLSTVTFVRLQDMTKWTSVKKIALWFSKMAVFSYVFHEINCQS